MNRPNILFVMTDDHTMQAMSCYDSKINKTPNMDRIANEGVRFNNCFCTNSLCAPSRATILTGKYSHINGVKTLSDRFDSRQVTFPKLLQKSGYQTALIGKWHLGHGGNSDPTGFDYWDVIEDQGDYFDSTMISMNGEKRCAKGYITDIVTDLSIDWLNTRDKEKPFLLMCYHKAPHRPWEPDEKHMDMYSDLEIPYPVNFDDDYSNRAAAASLCMNKIEWLGEKDCKGLPPEGLTDKEVKRWKYQRFIKDYLRVVASVDDNIGRFLDYIEEENISENTIVVYTSDQGFFLGEHGWFCKRFMYEEPLKMPFIVRYPKEIKAGSVCDNMILNTDFAPTFLDYANIEVPDEMQGVSFRDLLKGETINQWRDKIYYRYYQHPDAANVLQHFGIRTKRYKLIKYFVKTGDYGIFPEKSWELFDLHDDPNEMNNLYYIEEYKELRVKLTEELFELKSYLDDQEGHEFTYKYHAYK